MGYSVDKICQMHGYSRQGYYQRKRQETEKLLKGMLLLEEIRRIRSRQPRIGGRKLYHLLKSFMDSLGLKLGRDRFFAFLKEHELLVDRRKRRVQTTNSRHRFHMYGNLIKEKPITRPNQVYVADITYIRTLEGFSYLSLLTDAYSRKIVGYDLSRSLSIEGAMRSLQKALRDAGGKTQGLVHHSDRGIQYCSYAYTDKLMAHGVQISMTEKDHVYENALAERVNGILKDEFMLGETLVNYQVAAKMVSQAIEIYNNERPHQSLNYRTPSSVHAN